MVEYSLVEQGVGFTAYLDAGDIFMLEQDGSLKYETLDTAAKGAAWLDGVFSECNS